MSTGATPLYVACAKGHTDIVRTLIAGGAGVNISNSEGITPLFIAAWNGHTTIFRALVDAGAR
jgi:ankyrin repeat protein